MQGARKFIIRVLLGLLALVCVRTLWFVAGALGWHPEQQLGRRVLDMPTQTTFDLIQFAAILLVTFAAWAAADYFLYRRPQLKNSALNGLQASTQFPPG